MQLYGGVGRVKELRVGSNTATRRFRSSSDTPAAAGVLPLGFHRGKLSRFSFENPPCGMELIHFRSAQPFRIVDACLPEQHKVPARTRRLRQTVSLNGISVCCLRMRFDEPEQLVNATRNLREQIRRVSITRFACGINCASSARATICQRAG